MYDDFRVYPWVLEIREYADVKDLLQLLPTLLDELNQACESLRGISDER